MRDPGVIERLLGCVGVVGKLGRHGLVAGSEYIPHPRQDFGWNHDILLSRVSNGRRSPHASQMVNLDAGSFPKAAQPRFFDLMQACSYAWL